MSLFEITTVQNLPDKERAMLNDLIKVWSNKLTRNEKRMRYYLGKNKIKDLGISIPPSLRDIETVVGWPAKAVDALAVRSRFEGFVMDSGEDQSLREVFDNNLFNTVYRQAVVSELVASCAFLTISKGMEGEPPCIVSAYSALNASALWDSRRKRIKCGLAVIEIDDRPDHFNEPLWVNLYTDTDVWEIKKTPQGWNAEQHPHSMGRPMIEPLVYQPTLDRPFGQSRISRAVMSITDSAVRTALRSEIAAEFFTAPQKYLIGADDGTFENMSKWEAYIGNIFAVTKDEDGDVPQFGQLAQASMQPHTDYMRSLAARFSGETNIPISELGVIHDNPSSAEAIYAAKEALVIEAESLNSTNGQALREIAKMALAIINDVSPDQLTDDQKSVRPVWRNPSMPSIVSQADAMVKIASTIPWIAESRVLLEEFGFGEDQIARLMNDKRRAEAKQFLEQQISTQQVDQTSEQYEDSQLGAIDNTNNFYRIMSLVKDFKRGSITRPVAIRMLQSLGLSEDEASELIDANIDAEKEVNVPFEMAEEDIIQESTGQDGEDDTAS